MGESSPMPTWARVRPRARDPWLRKSLYFVGRIFSSTYEKEAHQTVQRIKNKRGKDANRGGALHPGFTSRSAGPTRQWRGSAPTSDRVATCRMQSRPRMRTSTKGTSTKALGRTNKAKKTGGDHGRPSGKKGPRAESEGTQQEEPAEVGRRLTTCTRLACHHRRIMA